MKYDFTSLIDRSGSDAIAVNPGADSIYRKDIELKYGYTDHIPMWVADMNFATFPGITKAMKDRIDHPLFGYFAPTEEYFEGIRYWHSARKGTDDILPEHIHYENSVLGGLSNVLHVVLNPGDKILLHSPTYIGFTKVLENNGYEAVHSPLVLDEKGIWRMDYEDMETKIRDQKIKAAILCSPHNPSGRVWEREELEAAMAIFEKYEVQVISDEIWSDLILPGYTHIPTQAVSTYAHDTVIALYAPTKTFNLAGLVGSYRVCYNPEFSAKLNAEAAKNHYNEMNLLSMYSLIGAYTPEGGRWVDELVSVIDTNVTHACDRINRTFDGISVTRPQGTYLLYLYCEEYLKKHHMSLEELLKKGYEAGVDWQDGSAFLNDGTIRMNLALPTARVEEAFDRLGRHVIL